MHSMNRKATQTTSFLFCFFALICFCAAENMMTGGLGEIREATEEIQDIANGVKTQAEAKCDTEFAEFTVTKYASQVVAGTNYFMKVKVGDNEYIHIRVYKPLPHTGEAASVAACQKSKTMEEPITYF